MSQGKSKKTETSSSSPEVIFRSQTENRRRKQNVKDDCQNDRTLHKDSLPNDTDMENIFQTKNPNLSDILKVLKGIFLSQQYISAKYDEFLIHNKQIEEKCNYLSNENTKLKEEVAELKSRVHNNEQILREKNVEIHGIPFEKEENLGNIIKHIAENFDIPLQERDIDCMYRIKNTRRANNKNAEPIIVTFMKKETKEKFMSSRRRRSVYAKEIGFGNSQNQIYVNEHLTSRNKELLWNARNIRKERNYKYVWYNHGNIYLRKNDNSEIIRINDKTDLAKL